MQFCMVYQVKSNVHLLYSFIYVFIHNSITKCFWQRRLEKPLLYLIHWCQKFRKYFTDFFTWHRSSILLLNYTIWFSMLICDRLILHNKTNLSEKSSSYYATKDKIRHTVCNKQLLFYFILVRLHQIWQCQIMYKKSVKKKSL